MSRTKSKAARGLITRKIRYRDRRNPPDSRPQDLKVDIRRGDHIDNDQAAAMVAARMGVPLTQVKIIEVVET
ncbi:MAG: hypothetical protein ACRDTT_21905 [Pseudonocardiaceae bacterium]